MGKTTVDSFNPNSLSAEARAVAIDSSGNIFVVGTAVFDNSGFNINHWITRRSD
jgi:hypothetical protein